MELKKVRIEEAPEFSAEDLKYLQNEFNKFEDSTVQICKQIDTLATVQEALRAYADPANWDGNTWIGEGSGGCWTKGQGKLPDKCDLTPHPFMIAQEALK